MPCFHPVEINVKRKAPDHTPAHPRYYDGGEMSVPCNKCLGCKRERTRQWAIRLMHEARYSPASWFLTLTYSDDNLPGDPDLDRAPLHKPDAQGFIKRLRERLRYEAHLRNPDGDNGSSGWFLRYFLVGEYGDQFGRPHYHALLFGPALPDRRHWCTRNGYPQYRSELVESCWPHGHSELAPLTPELAAYAAGYATKKLVWNDASGPDRMQEVERRYGSINRVTGELEIRPPEFAIMSRRPGIGRPFWERHGAKIAQHDSVIHRGKEQSPPRYYLERLKQEDFDAYVAITDKRWNQRDESEHTPARLRAKETVAKARQALFDKRANYDPRDLRST